MLKYFCDRCGGECLASDSSAKIFDKLAETKYGQLGLQVTPTFKGQIGPGTYICRECTPDLLILAAKTFTDTGVVAKQSLMQSDAKNYAAMKRILEQQLEMATKREKAAEAQLLEAAQCIADAEKQRLSDQEQITALQASIAALTTKLETVARIKVAADKQLAEDIRNNPDYIQRVEHRERIRASK